MALAKRAPRSNSVHARKHCSISYLVSGVIFIRSVRNTRQGGRQLTRPLLAGLEGGGEERQGEKESSATHPVLLAAICLLLHNKLLFHSSGHHYYNSTFFEMGDFKN